MEMFWFKWNYRKTVELLGFQIEGGDLWTIIFRVESALDATGVVDTPNSISANKQCCSSQLVKCLFNTAIEGLGKQGKSIFAVSRGNVKAREDEIVHSDGNIDESKPIAWVGRIIGCCVGLSRPKWD